MGRFILFFNYTPSDIYFRETKRSMVRVNEGSKKYAQFTGKFLAEDCKKRGMNVPFGVGLTKQAYQLNVSAFLNASKQYLVNNDSWESNKFDLKNTVMNKRLFFVRVSG